MSDSIYDNDLIAAYLEGELSPVELETFNTRLVSDAAFADALAEQAQLHAALRRVHTNADRAPQPVVVVAEPAAPAPPSRWRLALPWVASSLAAAIITAAAAFGVYQLVIHAPTPDTPEPGAPAAPVATLIEATGGTLAVDDERAHEGSEYPTGAYVLDGGHAQFVLRSRVSVDLEGATRLRVYNSRSVALSHGTASFRVPKGVDGFTVFLPDKSKIVDLGTAFRVEVGEDGKEKLRVLEGSVAWTPAGYGAKTVLLEAGQTAMMIDGVPTPTANPGLVAYWPLNDGPVGSTVTGADDVIDDPNHPATDATVEGEGDTWVEDADRGVVYSTTATSNLIAGTQGITGDFTWSLWIKTDEASHRVVMGNRSGSQPWNKLTTIGLNSWVTVGAPDGDFGVADDAWHHMAVRRSGDTVAVYIDGVPTGTVATVDAESEFDGPLRIGGDSIFGERVTALLSDAAVWDIALSEERIAALAAGGPVVLPEPTAADIRALSELAGSESESETENRQRAGDKD